MSGISAIGLGHRYRKVDWALRDLTFTVPTGSVTALVGANAAGKTTLLEILAGARTPSVGKCTTGARVRLVSHDRSLYRHMNAGDHLTWARRSNTRWNDRLARGWLEDFGVPLNRKCGALSTGQQAQVALAIALGAEPDTLLLDEVLANLDPVVRVDVVAGLLGLNADAGMTIVLSTHTTAELAGAADHLLLLSAGRQILCGPIDDLLEQHRRYRGPGAERLPLPGDVVWTDQQPRQTTILIRHEQLPLALPRGWSGYAVTLDELVLDYLRAAYGPDRPGRRMRLLDSQAS